MNRISPRILAFGLVALGLFAIRCPADEAIQIDVKELLNARVIEVVKDGAVIPLRDDVDGAGGMATAEAAEKNGDKNPHPLPNDAIFPATKSLPKVVLHYGPEVAAGESQARRSLGEDTFFLPVPAHRYGHLYLFCTSGWGASKIAVKLIYDDQTVERRDLVIPDWYWDLKPEDTYQSYLISDLGKWNRQNKMIEAVHHSIFAIDINPNAAKTLAKIAVHKGDGGLMVLYGATGVPAGK